MNGIPVKRERFEADVIIVGAGVAGLSTAIRIFQQVNSHNKRIESGQLQGEKLSPPQVMVVEKAADIGNHVLSGAVLDPVALAELLPDYRERGAPVEAEVIHNPFYFFTSKTAFKLPFTPPGMGSRGCLMVSLAEFTRWMSKLAESFGVQLFTGFAAVDLLREGNAVKGIRLGDKGIDKHGSPRPNALYGDEIAAGVTVLAEGVHGCLTRQAVQDLRLSAQMPQATVIGIKEIIQLPEERLKPGTALHSFGFPHDSATYGGGFVYSRPGSQAAVGLATGLDYKNPLLDMHELFLQWKSHPFMKKLLQGGKVLEYGAKTIPEGGYFSIPTLASDGLVIVGDGAGLLNSIRLKGVHLAIRSGMAAGDAIFQALQAKSWTRETLENYPRAFYQSWAGRELFRVRNLHQGFHLGRIGGMAGIALHTASFGLLPAGRIAIHPDRDSLHSIRKKKPGKKVFTFKQDALMLDRLSDVYLSGTVHDEEQPSHITITDPQVCEQKCKPEFDCPCTRFCPAQVYEWIEEEKRIRVNFTNCLHCQTCETKDPYANIIWKLPEGEGGPKYKHM
ncbi:electron transfer flavoprotein-ubiquinone oxidoreductase [bacterium]|nr:electron transfer flavoprotein-ubiquinone oxidoreductase [bacterium]